MILEIAEEKETLLEDLIRLSDNLIISSGELGKEIVHSVDVIKGYFRDFLFASFYRKTGQEGGEDGQNNLIQQTGSRAGDKKKKANLSQRSR